MPRFAYVNGRYVAHREGRVHIEDRGYQFADGVYEVVPVFDGKLVDEEPHLDRLDYSLGELKIAQPCARPALRFICRELVRRNCLRRGILYMQVTRGVASRDHKFPATVKSALVVTTKNYGGPTPRMIEEGARVITIPDIRWARCDIKSISLLPNVLGKQQAVERGAFEAWLIDRNGNVTEGTSTNAWIVTSDKRVITRQLGNAILAGVTRASLRKLMADDGYKLEERPFTLAEAKSAAEAFLTSSTSLVLPITQIDDDRIGGGKPGPMTRKLREAMLAYVAK
jgi:D-alanine transaminase